MAVPDVILRELALVLLHLLREKIRAEGLLQNRIPHVFLIHKPPALRSRTSEASRMPLQDNAF